MSAAKLLLAVLLLCPCLAPQESNDQAPSFSTDSIVNSADNSPGLAPNVLGTVYGRSLANVTETASLRVGAEGLPIELGNVRIKVGGISIPLLYVSPTQINFLIPPTLRAGRTSFVVLRQTRSAEVEIELLEVAPALFLVEGGRLAATHADGSLITAASPAQPGEIIVVYGGGLGITDPKQNAGAIPRAAAPIVSIDRFQVVFGDRRLRPEDVLYAGITPGYPGLYQINLRLPGVIASKEVELRVGFDRQMSQSGLTLEVTPNN